MTHRAVQAQNQTFSAEAIGQTPGLGHEWKGVNAPNTESMQKDILK